MLSSQEDHLNLSPAPKRKGFEIIHTIFRKRARDSNKENSDSIDSMDQSCSPDANLDLTAPYNLLANCPVSPRVRNIKADMEALIMSRQDNPFLLQHMELLSASSESDGFRTISPECPDQTVSSDEAAHSLLSFSDMEEIQHLDETDLHSHLIRSPPPQFPQKFSHFVFPGPESPLRSLPLKRPPVMKAASESAAMSLSIPHMNEYQKDVVGQRLLRRASAGGQIETDPSPTSGYSDPSFEDSRFMSLPTGFTPKKSMSGPNVGAQFLQNSDSQEALLANN